MKKIHLLAALLVFFVSLANADTIYLKNGRQIQCTSAWEEGREVKYKIGNGRMGIPKSMVAKIVKGTPATPPTQAAPTQVQSKEGEMDAKTVSQLVAIYSASGEELIKKKDYAGAIDYFQKAYRLQANAQTTLALAATYYFLKDDSNAELYFNQLLVINPKDTDALDYLGEIAWRNEHLSDAVEYWQKSLAIKPDPAIQAKLNKLQKEKRASDSYENSTTRHFMIRYDGGAVPGSLLRQISDFLEDTYRQFAAQFENYPNDPFIIVLYPRQAFFKATDLPFWAGGANDGKIKLPIKGITSLNDELKEVITHEMAHSFVRIKTSNNCPVWLQEGIAQYSEGKRTNDKTWQILARMASRDDLPSIHYLAGSFLNADSNAATFLYSESLAFTEYLIDRFQFYQLNEVLDQLGKESSYEQAFERVYGEPFSQLELEWRRKLIEQSGL